jgi:microcystin-dependent protein
MKRRILFFIKLCVVLIALAAATDLSAQTLEQRVAALEARLSKAEGRLETFEAPIGTIVAFAGPEEKIPQNWRLCNGDSVSKNDYPKLWDKIRNYWGGDGNPLFKLPDLQGMFLRGVSKGSGVDKDIDARTPLGGQAKNEVGSIQQDAMQDHTHTRSFTVSDNVYTSHDEKVDKDDKQEALVDGNGKETQPIIFSLTIGGPSALGAGQPRVGKETRPVNAYVHWIIKVQ